VRHLITWTIAPENDKAAVKRFLKTGGPAAKVLGKK
jgi:hypothetical protein